MFALSRVGTSLVSKMSSRYPRSFGERCIEKPVATATLQERKVRVMRSLQLKLRIGTRAAMAVVMLGLGPMEGLAQPITEIIDSTGAGAGSRLEKAAKVAVDSARNVYVTGTFSDNAFKIMPAGVITEIIDANGDGLGNNLDQPEGIAVDSMGNVYITGFATGALDGKVFKITPAPSVSLIMDFNGDGTHRLRGPSGIAVDANDNLYVSGFNSDNVFKITDPGGAGEVIKEIIDASGDGMMGHPLNSPRDLAVDRFGNVYVAGMDSDNAFMITDPGGSNVIAQIIDSNGDGVNNLDQPNGVAVDGMGNVYVGGQLSSNVFKITDPGGSNVIAQIIDSNGDGTNLLLLPYDATVDASGNVYVTGSGTNNAFKITDPGVAAQRITRIIDAFGDRRGNVLDRPWGITVDDLGNVYVAGFDSDNVFKIEIGLLCGNGACNSGEDNCNCPADCPGSGPENTSGVCADMIDNDCDGFIDCSDTDCQSIPCSACNIPFLVARKTASEQDNFGPSNPCPYPRESFGTRVAIHGNMAVVTAPYDRQCLGPKVPPVGICSGSDSDRHCVSGATVDCSCLSDDACLGPIEACPPPPEGSTVSTGSADVFAFNGSAWDFQHRIELPAQCDWQYGNQFQFGERFVAIDGDRVMTTQLGKKLYFFDGPDLVTADQALCEDPGYSSGYQSGSISGNLAVVGAPNFCGLGGRAIIYRRSGSGWSEEAKVSASSGASFATTFGEAVAAMSAPGGREFVAVGVVPGGSVDILEPDGTGEWVLQATLPVAGRSLGFATSPSGVDRIVVGAPGEGSGAAYVFRRDGTNWVREDRLTAGADPSIAPSFGTSVSISGNRIVVGMNNDSGVSPPVGSAFVFRLVNNGTPDQTDDFWIRAARVDAGVEARSLDWFGRAVSISGDHVLVGAGRLGECPQLIYPGGAAFFFNVAGDDCNGNGTPDLCDVAPSSGCSVGTCTAACSLDCNQNCIPDECEQNVGSFCVLCPAGSDCSSGNGWSLEVRVGGYSFSASPDCPGVPTPPSRTAGDMRDALVACINSAAESDCAGTSVLASATTGTATTACFDLTIPGNRPEICVGAAGVTPGCCVRSPDVNVCSFNPDLVAIERAEQDCNGNGVDDAVDIFVGTSVDCNANGVPDECEVLPCPPVFGACCDHDPFGGCTDGVTYAECTCARCEWTGGALCDDVPCPRDAIPTVSAWGLAILTLLLLTGAKIRFGRVQRSEAAL